MQSACGCTRRCSADEKQRASVEVIRHAKKFRTTNPPKETAARDQEAEDYLNKAYPRRFQ
jgi:hypothetical protein